MFKSYRIGSLIGIPIKLDVTFLLILPIFAALIAFQVDQLVPLLNVTFGTTMAVDPLVDGYNPWILGSVAALGLFGSVLLHELGHSVVAIRYGFPIDSITLWLLGGVAQLSEQPTNWRQELAIAVAGPIVSVGLGILFWIGALSMPAFAQQIAAIAPNDLLYDSTLFVFAYLAVINLLLAAFNMLPGFPMDGGRVLRALLARNRPFPIATQQAAAVGKAFAIILGLFGLLAFNLILVAIAFFIYIAAAGEARYTAVRAAMEGVTVADVMTPARDVDAVEPSVTVEELLRLMFEQRHTGYPVIERDEVVGVVTLEDVRSVPPEQRETTAVSTIMSRDLETVEPGDDAITAFEGLQRNDIGRLIVLDDRNRLAGLLTRSDLMTAMNIGFVHAPSDRPRVPEAGLADRQSPSSEVDGPRW